MFQIYPTALDLDRARCVYEGGQRLVQSGRLALLADTTCREAVITGCSSQVAVNSPVSDEDAGLATVDVDDGSCLFEHPSSASAERGTVGATDEWQTIVLAGSYTRPLIFCGVLSRSSTIQATVRVQNLRVDLSGKWKFEIKAEQKACHLADPPPLAELISYLVVEAGLAPEGWQAGVLRVRNEEWHRGSFHMPFESAPPVVLTTVQNFEERITFVTSRQHLSPRPLSDDLRSSNLSTPHFSFFVQVEGEGIWCVCISNDSSA